MAINATYNSILNEIQLSNLNYSIQLTPYAAYIVLKKSTQVNLNGVSTTHSPPVFLLFQQLQRDLKAAIKENTSLRAALYESEKKCAVMENTTISLTSEL